MAGKPSSAVARKKASRLGPLGGPPAGTMADRPGAPFVLGLRHLSLIFLEMMSCELGLKLLE